MSPQSRLGEAEKQLQIAIEKLDGDAPTDDLHEAISLVDDARWAIRDADDGS